jgi:hypothetical protein
VALLSYLCRRIIRAVDASDIAGVADGKSCRITRRATGWGETLVEFVERRAAAF